MSDTGMAEGHLGDLPTKEDLASARTHFEKFLRSKSLKLTSQRYEIFERAAQLNTHFSAEELVGSFRRRKQRPSKATIYRTLSLLTECAVLDSHDIHSNSSTIYEFVWGRPHHDHLICVSCSKIIEFFSQDIEDHQDEVAKNHDFHPTFHSQKIYGICSECWGKGVREL